MWPRIYELTRIHTGKQLTPLSERAHFYSHYWPNMDSETEERVLDFMLVFGDFFDGVDDMGFALRDLPDGDVKVVDLSEFEQEMTAEIKKLEVLGLYTFSTVAPRPVRMVEGGYKIADTLILHVRHAKLERVRAPAKPLARRNGSWY